MWQPMTYTALLAAISVSGCWRERGPDAASAERSHDGDHHAASDRDHREDHDPGHPDERR